MKQFLSNPLEYILNQLGYTMVKKNPLILDHMLRTTNNGWLKRMTDNNNLQNYKFNLYLE